MESDCGVSANAYLSEEALANLFPSTGTDASPTTNGVSAMNEETTVKQNGAVIQTDQQQIWTPH